MFTTSKPLINFILQFYLNVDRWQSVQKLMQYFLLVVLFYF